MHMNTVDHRPRGILRLMDQFVCGLSGHDEMIVFEPHRLSLHCYRCGRQSAGWEVRSPRAAVPDKQADAVEDSHLRLRERKLTSVGQRPMLQRLT
jgi:hypothetical protein